MCYILSKLATVRHCMIHVYLLNASSLADLADCITVE